MTDKILLPKVLTAKNGAKYLLSGEFSESEEIVCPECLGNWEESDCGCNEGTVLIDVPVSWSTIKDIYKKIVTHYGTDIVSAQNPHIDKYEFCRASRCCNFNNDNQAE